MPDVAAAPERTLPHSLDAEKSVLGAILIHNDAFNHAAELIDSQRLLPRRAPPHLRQDGRAQRTRRCHRLHHAEGRARPRRRPRRSRRAVVHRGAGRRRAALGQRRVLRAHRQGKVDAAQPDSLGEQDSDRGLRSGAGAGDAPRRSRALDLRDCRGTDPRGFRAAPGSRAEQLRDDREAAAEQGGDHRRAERVPRPRRDDHRLSPGRSGRRRGAAVDGEDELRPEHRAARRHAHRDDGGVLQPRDVERAAVHAHADVRGAHRRPSFPQRLSQREGLRQSLARAGHARGGARVHRRHGVDRRPRDAREDAPAQGRARPGSASSSTTFS